MRVLITGANGFIGKNLRVRLGEYSNIETLTFIRGQGEAELRQMLELADAIVHLAGENRPDNLSAFDEINVGLTDLLCRELKVLGKNTPIIFASSTQAEQKNNYGESKLKAEQILVTLSKENKNPVAIYRLPGVFGKWCRPNYNSVVATFCHNKARNEPVLISNPTTCLRLVYVDDVVNEFIKRLNLDWVGFTHPVIEPCYTITLGELSSQIDAFKNCRTKLVSEPVGGGLIRALYSTYISYLPPESFSYELPVYRDKRGVFVEIIKTPNAGQFSFFTAYPGVTRGGHYHHTKSEKFLVVRGSALFRFRNLITNQLFELRTSESCHQVVDTIPGWAHDITNIGNNEMIVMLWSSEIFDSQNPDTIACKV